MVTCAAVIGVAHRIHIYAVMGAVVQRLEVYAAVTGAVAMQGEFVGHLTSTNTERAISSSTCYHKNGVDCCPNSQKCE
jgi:hypothetical protein